MRDGLRNDHRSCNCTGPARAVYRLFANASWDRSMIRSIVYIKWGDRWLREGSSETYDAQPFVRLFGQIPETTSRLEFRFYDSQPQANGIKIVRAKNESQSFLFYLERKAVQGTLSRHIAEGLTGDEFWITGHAT